MELLLWAPVQRKRNKKAKYTDADYVKGYDLDISDFTELVVKYNQNSLKPNEESRLYDHIRTVINIVLENPKMNPKTSEERDSLTDAMFLAMWGSMKYIKGGANPYSYIYRCGFTSGSTFYKRLYKQREKATAIQEHIDDCYTEYMDSISDRRVITRSAM